MPKSLNEIDENDYSEIRSLAGALFTPKKIAIIRDIDINSFVEECNTEGTRCFQEYNAGLLKTEFELQSAIILLAKRGSSPAQTMAITLLTKAKINKSDT